ncbi:MAG: Ig-like domain-containing protein, partial [Blastocatellia bacterium]
MFSLHVGQTLVRLIRAYAKAQRPGRYCSWLGLALVVALAVNAGVTLAWRDISSNSVSSVPAASYEAVPIAPESIVTAFGSNLATRPAEASDADPNTPGVQLPTTLDGTTVEVNGRRAGLLFVSPTQVNYVMPEATEIGLVNVVVKSGDGATSNGIAQITQISPAIFTANATGKGVPAALIFRRKADGRESYESLSHRSGPGGPLITKPIEMPVGDQVALVLYLTGVRRAAAGSVRVLMGGEELTPLYSGAAPDFIGLDQINVEIPRSLAGRGVTIKVSVTAGGATSNPVDIEMAGVGGASPPQVGVSGDPVLAGSEMLITGSGFSPIAAENIVRIGAGLHQAEVMRATPTLLTVLVPFGVEAGTVRVSTPTGEGVSASELSVRTSISGLVEDTLGRPLKDVRVSAILRDRTVPATTDAEGHFVLPDVGEGLHPVEVDGGAINVNHPYPKVPLKIIAQRNRDNAFPRAISLQQSTGSGGSVGSGSSLSDDVGQGLSAAQQKPGSGSITIRTDDFKLELQDPTQARFPDNTTSGNIFLTPLENARTPVELPFGYFSSSIAQITPFGVELDPGAKLIFPNKDGLPAGAPAILYRYDERDGKFVQDSAKAFVSADGQWIETEPGAIKITTYYFAAKFRDSDLTTIYGHVFEKGGKPVARALARFKGHEASTDNTGSYVLRYVAVKEGEEISVEASAIRPNGRVDRAVSAKVASTLGGATKAPDVIMPGVTENRPPTIIGPKSLAIEAGKTREERIIVTDPDPNQTLQVKVEDAPFATVIRGGFTTAVAYTLRLSPTFAQAGRYKLRLTATDGAGGIGTYAIDVTVKSGNRAPTVNNKTVVMDEDTPGAIKLEGADLDANRLSFAVVTQPSKGRLSGSAPNLIYTPNLNFAGSDRFTFKANDGDKDSNIATVTITVRPVNDPPSLAVPAAPRAQPVSEG